MVLSSKSRQRNRFASSDLSPSLLNGNPIPCLRGTAHCDNLAIGDDICATVEFIVTIAMTMRYTEIDV